MKSVASAKDVKKKILTEKWLHRFFWIGVWFKGIDGVLETVGGALLLFLGKATLNQIIRTLTQHELTEDPHDWLANTLRQVFSHLTSNQKLFGAVYLLGHGAIKIFLVAGLLREKLWSFPTAMVFIAVFIGYQSYRVIRHFSWGLIFLMVLDLLVLFLIWHEYTVVKKRGPPPSPG